MKKTNTAFWFLLLLLSVALHAQEEKNKAIDMPSEEDVGRVFISSVFVALAHSPPDQILVYPALYARGGTTEKTSGFSVLIEGGDVSDFLHRLARPTKIGTAEESCPGILFCWDKYNPKPDSLIGSSLKGSIYVSDEADYVRIRLHTNNYAYPKIDFVYIDTGLKAWLQQRSIALDIRSLTRR